MLGKRTYRNYFYTPTGRTPKRRGINLTRPPTYRRNQAWQDWRAMKYIARKPLNLRTGGFIGKELKFVDYSRSGGTGLANTWTLCNPASGALNAVAQGDGESQRIGRKITPSSLHIRGVIDMNSSTSNTASVRVVVVKDLQTNAAALTPSQVMTPGLNGFRNLEYVSRFQVVYDKIFTLSPAVGWNSQANTVLSNGPDRYFRINLRCNDKDILFDGPTADISDIVNVAYSVIACGTTASGVGFNYESRFRYLG